MSISASSSSVNRNRNRSRANLVGRASQVEREHTFSDSHQARGTGHSDASQLSTEVSRPTHQPGMTERFSGLLSGLADWGGTTPEDVSQAFPEPAMADKAEAVGRTGLVNKSSANRTPPGELMARFGGTSEAFWEHGFGPGSQNHWNHGFGPGSENYWNHGHGQGSETFWEHGFGPGSRNHWNHGFGPGSENYWNHGFGPGSRTFWNNGFGTGVGQ